jgi:transposase InsO family protein
MTGDDANRDINSSSLPEFDFLGEEKNVFLQDKGDIQDALDLWESSPLETVVAKVLSPVQNESNITIISHELIDLGMGKGDMGPVNKEITESSTEEPRGQAANPPVKCLYQKRGDGINNEESKGDCVFPSINKSDTVDTSGISGGQEPAERSSRETGSSGELEAIVKGPKIVIEKPIRVPPFSIVIDSVRCDGLNGRDVEILGKDRDLIVLPTVVSVSNEGRIPIVICNLKADTQILRRDSQVEVEFFHEQKHEINVLEGQQEDDNFWPETTETGELMSLFDFSEVPVDALEPLQQLVTEYKEIFLHKNIGLGCTNVVKHKIDVGESRPIKKRPYRVPHSQRLALNEAIREMLTQGIISPSTSPWSAPIILVRKKVTEDGMIKYRPCIDYRALNNVTKKDVFPIPNMDEAFDQLGGAAYFSSMDLCSGYWQVEMEEESKEYTAFSTPEGHFQCNRMSFGLANAPSTFMRLMTTVLEGLINNGCLVYLDDILRYDRNWIDHLKGLRRVFERLRKANLRLTPKKTKLFRKQVLFLGHSISAEGLRPDESKVEAIKRFPQPKDTKQLQSFLGLVGYYRKFILNFANISSSLTKNLSKNTNFVWESEQQTAFETLRNCLLSRPVLRFPDFAKPFILTTDASSLAVAGILSQSWEDGEHPVAYASKQLHGAQKAYSATELECLAVVQMVRKFRVYLLGKHFILQTDHKPLRWLLALKEPTPRLARWVMELSEFSFEIQHIPGRELAHADSLSRAIPEVFSLCADGAAQPFWDKQNIAREQAKCTELKPFHDRARLHDPSYFYDDDNVLYVVRCRNPDPQFVICAPRSMRNFILKRCHDNPLAGHLGFNKTLEIVQRHFHWEGCYSDVQGYVQNCLSCKKRKAKSTPVPLQPVVEATYPLEKLSLDIVGPLPKSDRGNRYILTCQDYFTRFPEAYAIPDQTAETIARVLVENIFCRHGVPKYILTDRGANFTSQLLQRVCKLLKIESIFTSPYNPGANGRLERAHQSFSAVISHYVSQDHKDWDEHLNFALFAYRNSRHRITGFTPSYLMYGRELSMPWDDILAPTQVSYAEEPSYDYVLRRRLQIAHAQALHASKSNTDLDHHRHNRNIEPNPLNVGQLVLLRNMVLKPGQSKKLVPRWVGPYEVSKVRSPVTYDIKHVREGRTFTAHQRNLVALPPDPDPSFPHPLLNREDSRQPSPSTSESEEMVTNETVENMKNLRPATLPEGPQTEPPCHPYNLRPRLR